MAKSLAKSWQGGSGHGSGGRGGGGETGGGGGGGGGEGGGGGRGEGGGGGGGSGGQLARRRRTALIKSNNPHLAGGELYILYKFVEQYVFIFISFPGNDLPSTFGIIASQMLDVEQYPQVFII